jgi:hypothetical protein
LDVLSKARSPRRYAHVELDVTEGNKVRWAKSNGDGLPVKGAIYWRGAASEAVAATMIEYFIASFSSRVLTS